MNPEIEKLWEEYSQTRSPETKDKLAGMYGGLVYKIAAKFAHKKPTVFEFEDIVQEGMLGLLDAIEKFEPERGFQFSTYAQIRIRGAIIDGINALDWTPRRVKKEIREVLTAMEKFGEHSYDQIATETGLTSTEVKKIINKMAKTYIVPMDFESILYHAPSTDFEQEEITQHVQHAIDTVLTVEEQDIVKMSLLEGYPNTEIAKLTHYSLKEVKKFRDSAIFKLKNELKNLE